MNRLFTTDNNLPNSLINKVAEDADENIWIATEDGLCCFNGAQFVNYHNDPQNPHSIQSDFVRTVCTDARGHILVATLNGVQMYRPVTDDFTTLITDEEANIGNGNATHLLLLANGDFLVTGNKTFTIHIDDDDIPHALPNPFTSSIGMTYQACQDLNGNLWVIRTNNGTYRLDTHGNLEEITHDGGQSYDFNSIGVGPDGNIYVGGLERGLYKFNRQSGRFEEITRRGEDFMVKDFCPIPDSQQMYVSTDGEGVKILDCSTGSLTPFLFDDVQVEAETQKVHSLTLSRNGDLWMALYQKGVFVMASNPVEFHYYGPKSLRYNCIGDRCITSILRTDDGNLWVATDNGGLYGINPAGQSLAHYSVSHHPNSVPSSFMRLFQDSRHRVWFGTFRQGGGIVDLSTGKCRYIPIQGHEGTPANIYDFAEDSRGQIWVASMGHGILRYDEQKQLFVPQSFPSYCDWSGAMRYDPVTDRLYVGTYHGLAVVHLSEPEPTCSNFEEQLVIFSITLRSPSQLCLCTNAGLIVFDTQTRQIQSFTTANGLSNNNVYAALFDADGNIWASGNSGLSRISMPQGTISTFTVQDGLQCSEFYKNAAFADQDGNLWFGGTSGIIWFNPHDIRHEVIPVTGRVVSFVSGQSRILPDAEGVYRIKNDDHSFSIELATRPILQTHHVQYRYSLDDDPWQTLPSNRVSFSQISSGWHTFRFQAIDDDNAGEMQQIRIYIAYPWYLSWWHQLILLTLLAVGILYSIQRARRLRYERHMRQLREQEAAINEAKLQFFMNIAHEFRTPMTLVVSPLQKLLSTDKDPQRQRSYQLMDRNANRVLLLINELMDIRKIDKEQMFLRCRKLAPVALLRNLCESVSDLVIARDLHLMQEDQITPDQLAWIDQDCFEKIFLNLLSNSIKYTPKGGRILVQSSCQQLTAPATGVAEDWLCIMITDTGIGIAEEDRKHIFERFYQVRHGKSSLGTGIGLNLVHLLVQLHHGTISVEANPEGQGTRFSVMIPLGDAHYTEAERVETSEEEPELELTVSPSDILHSTLRQEDEPASAAPLRMSRRVLVVDDDDEVRNYLLRELSARYNVTACSDGRQAIDLLLTESYDMVVSDVMMPVLDGIQLCQRIRSNVLLNHLPIILLTAKSSDEDRLQSLEVGANAFISKPFNMEILQQTIKNLLREHDRLRSSYGGQQLPVDKVDTPKLQSPDERLLQRVLKIINENLSNPDLTTEMIAQEVGMSRVHLYRKLKELTNQSGRSYIRNIRLAKAAELLSQKNMAIAEVAYRVGFSNPNNFTTAFKEMYGVSPSTYNSKHAGDANP